MPPSVPRLVTNSFTKAWIRDPTFWSPRKLLAGDDSFFPPSTIFNVKRSFKSRFFMYEEHADTKLRDKSGPTKVIQLTPAQLSDALYGQTDRHVSISHEDQVVHEHHYCTFPVAKTAPGLLRQVEGYRKLHGSNRVLDPRGPSLWIGTSGSSTQAHYDVADNVICQLFGTKRIRCYNPSAASALHVFPDAHPRARKSQVDFDKPNHKLFSKFSSLPPPDVDVVLRPGSTLFIPAFWFHHVENGLVGKDSLGHEIGDHGPSVSLNLFAISDAMIISQNIFRDASQPFRVPTTTLANSQLDAEFAVAALHALTWKLMLELNICHPEIFIQEQLLDARYAPLHDFGLNHSENQIKERLKSKIINLTSTEEGNVANCVAQILPQFKTLREIFGEGVMSITLCHLLELWAVEMVGASTVAELWEAVLFIEDRTKA